MYIKIVISPKKINVLYTIFFNSPILEKATINNTEPVTPVTAISVVSCFPTKPLPILKPINSTAKTANNNLFLHTLFSKSLEINVPV